MAASARLEIFLIDRITETSDKPPIIARSYSGQGPRHSSLRVFDRLSPAKIQLSADALHCVARNLESRYEQ